MELAPGAAGAYQRIVIYTRSRTTGYVDQVTCGRAIVRWNGCC